MASYVLLSYNLVSIPRLMSHLSKLPLYNALYYSLHMSSNFFTSFCIVTSTLSYRWCGLRHALFMQSSVYWYITAYCISNDYFAILYLLIPSYLLLSQFKCPMNVPHLVSQHVYCFDFLCCRYLTQLPLTFLLFIPVSPPPYCQCPSWIIGSKTSLSPWWIAGKNFVLFLQVSSYPPLHSYSKSDTVFTIPVVLVLCVLIVHQNYYSVLTSALDSRSRGRPVAQCNESLLLINTPTASCRAWNSSLFTFYRTQALLFPIRSSWFNWWIS